MIDHTGIGVADMARSAAFYDAALGALGLRRVEELAGADGIGYGVDRLPTRLLRRVRARSGCNNMEAAYRAPRNSTNLT